MKLHILNLKILIVLFSIGLLAGCGSNGNGDNKASTTVISGSVFASNVGGATITVEDTAGHTVAGPVLAGSDGTYHIDVPNSKLSGDLIFKAADGTFTDEATGDTGVSGGDMGAYVAGGTMNAGSQVHITPPSTIVQKLVSTYNKELAEAKSAFESAFGQDMDISLSPLDATDPPSGADQDRLRSGLQAAAFSQLAKDLVLSPADQFALFAALTDDLSDGTLDGLSASGPVTVGTTSVKLPVDIQNRYERAFIGFKNGARNKTGLTADKIGFLPFARVALTDHYKIEYITGMMEAMEGKTSFSLNITDRVTDQGVTGLTVELMPVMYMATMSHGTAVDGCVESSTAGNYNCTIYYLMASRMSDGMSMGYWELKVTAVGGITIEDALFYPDVMMAMGDTARSVLKGQNDKIAGMSMGMSTARNYYLFKDGLSGTTGNHTFKLFIAAREGMMSHTAVSVGTIFNSGTMYELTVSSMIVEASTDGIVWIPMTDIGGGHWTVSGITGLTDDSQGYLYVRLTVNGEQKTTNGSTPAGDGSNDYGTFIVTP